jgi:hypothetical protein
VNLLPIRLHFDLSLPEAQQAGGAFDQLLLGQNAGLELLLALILFPGTLNNLLGFPLEYFLTGSPGLCGMNDPAAGGLTFPGRTLRRNC